MLELYQAEWCPHSHAVREHLTELGIDFVARQVPPDREDRTELMERTGSDEIPTLVVEDGTVVSEEDAIIAYLDGAYPDGPHAEGHRRKAAEH